MSKIDKVLFSCNDKEIYYGFWESISEHFATEFGIEPILLCYGDFQENQFTGNYGHIVHIPKFEWLPEKESYIPAAWGRFWLTELIADHEICMIGDIDMYPLSREFFDNDVINHNSYVHLNADHYHPGNRDHWKQSGVTVPVCYHVAPARLFRDVYKFNSDFGEEIKKIKQHDYSEYNTGFANTPEPHLKDASAASGGMWGFDEMYSTAKMREYINDTGNEIITPSSISLAQRICRSRLNNHPHPTRCIDFHAPRPYNDHREQIHQILDARSTRFNTFERGPKHALQDDIV